MQTRLNRIEEFIKEGNKVMVRIKFKGREMGHQELGYGVLNKIMAHLGEKVQTERDPKMEGRSITVILGKNRGGNKINEKVQA